MKHRQQNQTLLSAWINNQTKGDTKTVVVKRVTEPTGFQVNTAVERSFRFSKLKTAFAAAACCLLGDLVVVYGLVLNNTANKKVVQELLFRRCGPAVTTAAAGYGFVFAASSQTAAMPQAMPSLLRNSRHEGRMLSNPRVR